MDAAKAAVNICHLQSRLLQQSVGRGSSLPAESSTVGAEHSGAVACWRQKVWQHQTRAPGLPTLASSPARLVQVVPADVQSTARTCIAVPHRFCVNQWHQLLAERDCVLPLVATLSSAQLSCTLVLGRLLLQDPKPGISFRQTFVRLFPSTRLKPLWRLLCSVFNY